MNEKQIRRGCNIFLTAVVIVMVVAWAAGLGGCAQGVTPETPKQRLAAVDVQAAAMFSTATDLRRAGMMSDEQYDLLDPIIQKVNVALDLAWASLGEGDLSTMDQQIRLINSLLWEIRKTLHEVNPDGQHTNSGGSIACGDATRGKRYAGLPGDWRYDSTGAGRGSRFVGRGDTADPGYQASGYGRLERPGALVQM